MSGVILGYLFIFFARVMDMSLDVIRTLMLTRGKNFYAAAIGFVEVVIFILALNKVMSDGLNDPIKIIAYAGGFATGNYVGGILENILAVGYLTLQIFPKREQTGAVINNLRKEGFGVTTITGAGRNGPRTIIHVILKRRDLSQSMQILNEIDKQIFYNISDARNIRGGVFPMRRGNNK